MLLDDRKTVPADESKYVAELKYDGYRVLAEFGDGPCTLKTRNGNNCTKWFPEVCEALSTLECGRTIIDGEVCVLDELGRTDFDALQARARRRGWKPGDRAVTYAAFDLLVVDGDSLMDKSLIERKERLEKILSPAPPNILYAKHVTSAMVTNPVSWLYAHALALELEGVVGKRSDSIYQPGERTESWFKLKRPGAVPPERFQRSR